MIRCRTIAWMLLVLFGSWGGVAFALSAQDAVLRGDELRSAGKLSEALGAYEDALRSEPGQNYARYWVGWILLQQGRLDDAFRTFEEVVARDRSHVSARVWMGLIQLQRAQIDKAFRTFQSLAEEYPESRQAHYYLGVVAYLKRDTALALRNLEAARRLDPNEVADRYRLARTYHHLGLFRSALLEYKNTLETIYRMTEVEKVPATSDLIRVYVNALNGMGWTYYHLGDREKAIESWQTSRQTDAKQTEANANLAKVYNEIAWEAR